MTTLHQRETIWRLRHLHNLAPKEIYRVFPDIPKPSIRRIYSTWSPPGREPAVKHPSAGKLTVSHNLDEISIDTTQQLFTNPDGTREPLSDDGRIRTLGDLVHATDIDQTRWIIYHWTSNSWEGQMKGPDGEVIITTLHQVKALMKPRAQALIDTIADSIREEIRAGHPPIPAAPTLPQEKHGRMLEISIPDMHFGKLALVSETGNFYDLDHTAALFEAAVFGLLESAMADGTIPELILLPVGNDLFHVDNAYLTTFAKTPVESVHSVKHLFRRVKNIIRDTIIKLNRTAPVEVLLVPGNHGPTLNYFLGEAIEDSFYNSPTINVHTTDMNRQYYRWKSVLLGFNHGDKPKRERLPYLMAHEAPQLHAATTFREWHLGHIHTEQEEKFMPISTHQGIVCRTLPSLCAADVWHHDRAFNTSPRVAQALLWDEHIGLAAAYYTRVLPDTPVH